MVWAHGFVLAHGIFPWYCMWLSLYKAWGGSIVKWPGGERWLAHFARMAGFGHVMKIFIGAGFPRMGFPGYIVCLSWMLLGMFILLLIIMLALLAFDLKTGIRAMVWLGYVRLCFYVHNQIVGRMFGGTRHPSSIFLVHVKLSRRQVWISLDA